MLDLQPRSRALAEPVEKTMTNAITIAPPNSLVLVTEAPTTTSPSTMGGSSIASTRSCIAVSCLMFQDGETRITLGQPLKTDDRPAFDGFLDTPHRKIAVWTVEWEKLLETRVPTIRTKIRIWTNHRTEPDDVYIGVGE